MVDKYSKHDKRNINIIIFTPYWTCETERKW